MPLAYPGFSNTFVPSWEATGQTIAFIRDPAKFKINEYVAFRPATRSVGLYLEYDFVEPARNLSLDQMGWAEGAERPTGTQNLAGFEYQEYATKRRSLTFPLGDQTVAQTPWPIVAAQTATLMQKAMTALTRQTLEILDTSSNWVKDSVNYYGTVEALIGSGSGTQYLDNGNVTPADANYLNLKKAINEVCNRIWLATNGTVTRDMIRMVISPTAARKISESAEIVDMLKQSPHAYGEVMGNLPNLNQQYGLPQKLYGVRVVVEDCVFTSNPKGATATKSFVKNDDTAIFLTVQNSMPGDQVGDVPIANFSTYQQFYYSDRNESDIASGITGGGLLTVSSLPDLRNKRTEWFVDWQTAEELVAIPSGFLLTDILA